jgi:hypothetical protein
MEAVPADAVGREGLAAIDEDKIESVADVELVTLTGDGRLRSLRSG